MIFHILQIAWTAVRELIYEKVFYLLLGFVLLSFLMSSVLGQMTYAEHAKLTLDFMLAGTELGMVLFSIFMGITLFKRELLLGSVSMVLSKPISRPAFLIGKFLGQVFVSCVVTFGMGLLTAAAASRFGDTISYGAIFQATFLTCLELIVVTACTYFLAVNTGVITAGIGALSIYGIGHLGDTIESSLKRNYSFTRGLWEVIKRVLPNLEIFNMKALASYGVMLPFDQMAMAVTYALICTVMYMFMASFTFQRKDIYT